MEKIISLEQIQPIVNQLKTEAKSIVLVGGCFDILHQGHIKYLKAAKNQGDILIVGLENDGNVQRLKGEGRPVNSQNIRAENLINTNLVDYVVILPDLKTGEDYLKMVKSISPTVIAITEGDPQTENKQRQADMVGAKLKVVIDRLPGLSTTDFIKISSVCPPETIKAMAGKFGSFGLSQLA